MDFCGSFLLMKMKEIQQLFIEKFNQTPDVIVTAPARINLIGEHTDYNGGKVFPAAIDMQLVFAIKKSTETKIFSANQNQSFNFNLGENVNLKGLSWQKYFVGIIDVLTRKMNLPVENFTLVFGGNIPLGAGLSSSAALTCGLVFALNELFALKLSNWQMAKIAQQCEHEYVGVNCGIMDQFAVLFGKKNTALLLNCQTLDFEEVQFDMPHHTFVLCNSMVSHNLASTAYNQRLIECREALDIINSKVIQHVSLSNIEEQNLNLLSGKKLIQKRAAHVFYENHRVDLLKEALKEGDFTEVGALLNQSHISLRDNYEVTCRETDFLFDLLNSINGVLGCRQMGGGFGGCILVLCKNDKMEDIKKQVTSSYQQAFNLEVQFYNFSISEGCSIQKPETNF
jgi:galactokinase